MKRLFSLAVFFLLFAVAARADMVQNGRQPRQWDLAVSSVKAGTAADYTDNTTVYANSVNTGNNAAGNPGYQALMAVDSAGVAHTFYLWVDASSNPNGVLKMASFASLSTYMTSFPYGDWRSSTGFSSGTKVSQQ